jgi:hypothetical protein
VKAIGKSRRADIRKTQKMFRLLFIVIAIVLGASAGAAQERQVWVRVEDPSGATIPGAEIIVLSGGDLLTELTTDDTGLALLEPGAARRLTLVVSAPSFATKEQEIDIPPRPAQPIRIALDIATIETGVTVSAEPEEAGGLTQTLSQAELEQLPDDPEELQQLLEEIAGPESTIQVDGFSGGRLPPREQIARVVVRRDAYSAEFHQIGQGRIDISTRPGVDRWRGNAGLNVRPSGLSAHNALARTSRGGTRTRLNAFVAGPLVRNRLSFAAEVSGASSENVRGISALTPNGPFVAALEQPQDTREITFRTEGLLTRSTLFRASFERGSNTRDNQGLSELDLPERGYRRESVDYQARLAMEGGVRRPFHLRFQYDQEKESAFPDLRAPAIVVQSAFRAGGATVDGSNRLRGVLSDNMFTVWTRPFTLRVGSLTNWRYSEQGQLTNPRGTFTFTDLDAYIAGRPSVFTQRVGAQPLAFWTGQGAVFAQGEVATRDGWSFGMGLRYEWQTGIDDRGALAPRFGASRAFRRGATRLRAGYGWFYGWMPTRIEEETLRLAQDSSEHEIIIRDPGYPDPFVQGLATTQQEPPTLLVLADSASLPRFVRTSLGIDHELRRGVRVGIDSFYQHSSNEFRSIDLNAPVDGVRPDPAFGRMLLVQSVGRSTRAGVNLELSVRPAGSMFASVRYGYSRRLNDGDDALTPPPLGTFDTEWGPARGESRHGFNWRIGAPVGPETWGFNASLNGRMQSGAAYNVTTGEDENGDAIFNDRPAGEPRNSRRGDPTAQTDLRISWRVTGRTMSGDRVSMAQRGPGGPRGGPGRGPGRTEGKRLEMFLSVQNLFNRVNYGSYVGVLTSPLFGTPTSAQSARRMELGWRFSF